MANTEQHPYPKGIGNQNVDAANTEMHRAFEQFASLNDPSKKPGHEALLRIIENSKHPNPHASRSRPQQSVKISKEILKDIDHWKKRFPTLKLRDNVMEAFKTILDTLLDNAPDINEEVFMCDYCYGQYNSAEEHYDLVLKSYVEKLTPMPVLNESESVFDFLRKQLRLFATNDRKRIFPNYVTQTRDLIQMQLERVQQLLTEEAKDDAATVGLALLHYLEDLHDKSFVLNSVCQLVTIFFKDDQDMIEHAFKLVLRTFPDKFYEAAQIHEFFRNQFLRAAAFNSDLESYKLAFAALHYADLTTTPGDFSDLCMSKRILGNRLNKSFNEDNYDLLSQVLVQISREGFISILQEFIATKSNPQLRGSHKAGFLLVKGTLLKMSKWEDIPEALQHFQNAILACSECPPHTKKDIINAVTTQLMNSEFHSGIIEHLWTEIRNVKNNLGDLFLAAPTILPELKIQEMFQLKSWDGQDAPLQVRIARQKEEEILCKFTTHFDKALGYFDLSQQLESGQQLSSISMAISHMLQAMKEFEDISAIYAYFKIIQMHCGSFAYLLRKSSGPQAQIYFQRFAASALVRSSLILRGELKEMPTDETENRTVVYEEIVSMETKNYFSQALNDICNLVRVYPFTTVPIHSVADYTIRQESESSFLTNFIHLKALSEHHRTYLPNYLYSYQEFESHWKGKYLLNFRNWNTSHVEKLLNWPTIQRTEQGWMNNEKSELNFENIDETQIFASCLGLRIDSDSEHFEILVDYGDTDSPKLFTLSDIREVMDYNVGQAFLNLEDPDPSMPANLFQEFQFWPHTFAKSEYLSTMMHADYFLKQLVTGIEVSANSPFELRPTSEGILKRLPEYLQRGLRPILERVKDPIHSYSENAHRFWIEFKSVETETSGDEGVQIYEFGEVELSVKTEKLSQAVLDGDEHTNSAEQEFADFFTKNYDAIGVYFPVLLRLKELAKLSAAQRILATRLEYQKNQIASLQKYLNTGSIDPATKNYIDDLKQEVRSDLKVFLKSSTSNPAHPICSPIKVEISFQQALREENLVGREGSMSYSERQALRNEITANLKELDKARFQLCAKKIAEDYGLRVTENLCLLIRGWLDKEELSTQYLETMCVKGKVKEKLEKLKWSVCKAERRGIMVDQASSREVTTGVDCTWVPSTFCSQFKKPVAFEDEAIAPNPLKTVRIYPEISQDLKPEIELEVKSNAYTKSGNLQEAKPEAKPQANPSPENEIQSWEKLEVSPESALQIQKIDTKKTGLRKLWSYLRFMILGPKKSSKIPRQASTAALQDYAAEVLRKKFEATNIHPEPAAVVSTDASMELLTGEPFHIPKRSTTKYEKNILKAKLTRAPTPTGIKPSRISSGGIAVLVDFNLETFTRPPVFRPKRVAMQLLNTLPKYDGDHSLTTDAPRKIDLKAKYYARQTNHSKSKVLVTLHRNNRSIPRQ